MHLVITIINDSSSPYNTYRAVLKRISSPQSLSINQGWIITIKLSSLAVKTWQAPYIFPALHNIFSQLRRPPPRVEPTWKGILQTFSSVLFPQKSFYSLWYCTDYERLASINHKIENVHRVCVWNIMNRFSLLFWHLPFKRQYGMPKINKIKGESYVLSILARELNRLNWFISSIPNELWFLLHALLYWISSTDGNPVFCRRISVHTMYC